MAEPLVGLDELRAKELREAHAADQLRGTFVVQDEMAEWEGGPAIDEGDGPTFFGETKRAVWGALVDSVGETTIAAKNLAEFFLPLNTTMAMMGSLYTEESMGEAVDRVNQNFADFDDSLRDSMERLAPANETTVGGAARGIATFLIPFAAWSKGVRAVTALSATARSFVAGGITDYSVFDPDNPNIANLLMEHTDLADPILKFLATSPDDSEALNRLRNTLEGIFLGGIAEGVMKGFTQVLKVMRQRRAIKEAEEVALKVANEPSPKIPESRIIESTDVAAAKKATPKPKEGTAPKPKDDAALVKAPEIEAPPISMRQTLRESLKLTTEQKAALSRAILNEDYSKARELIDFNSKTIDWDAMDEGDNMRQMLNTFSEIIAENMDQVKGGVQTLAESNRLARLVGISGDQVHQLYTTVRGDKGLTARMMASNQTLLASLGRLRELAEVARKGANEDVLKLHRHIELHAALMAEVKGSSAEIARAMHAMRDMKSAAAMSFKEFDEIKRVMGGHKNTGKIIDEILQSRVGDLDALTVIVVKTTAQRWRDAIAGFVVNGLLALPKTQIVNLASNVLNTGLQTADRYIAGVSLFVIKRGDRTMIREANADAWAKISSINDAWTLARKAFAEGKPITDVRQRIEFDARGSIRAELFGTTDKTWYGRSINAIGKTIELPGRFLMSGDEFFKAINVRGETAALSYRQAAKEADVAGLTGEALARRIRDRTAELIKNPTPHIQRKSIEQARLATFQESAQTAPGRAAERMINSSMLLKLIIAPFFRTPMNIIRQGLFDRTILGVANKEIRRSIMAGGPDAAITIARMTTGTAAIVGAWALIGKGGPDSFFEVVGKRPFGNTATIDNVPDYSIRIGKTWYQYNKFDPAGSWLGMVADVKTHLETTLDPNDPNDTNSANDWIAALGTAMYRNTVNKSFFTSVQEITAAIEVLESGTPEAKKRASDRLIASNLFKLVPFSSLTRGIANSSLPAGIRGRVQEGLPLGPDLAPIGDPEMEAVWGIWDRIAANIPGLNTDLPKRRDYLGRVVTKANATWALFNSFAANPESTDVLDRELGRLAFDVQPLPKSIKGGDIPLSDVQWSEYKRLIGQDTRTFGGQNLETFMREFVESPAYTNLPSDFLKTQTLKDLYSIAKSIATVLLIQDDIPLEGKTSLADQEVERLEKGATDLLGFGN